MTKSLDVLVIGGRSSEAGEEELRRRGHRTHRCQEVRGATFPCAGVVDPDSCPLEADIDVALLVRRGIQPQPLPEEAGIRCALRAGIPVVEDAVDVLDPYDGWVTRRIGPGDDVVSACVTAGDERFTQLRTLVRQRISKLAVAAGTTAVDTACLITSCGGDLVVDLHLPVALNRRQQQALAVRVLDAVRASGRTYGHVDVRVHGAGGDAT